MAKFVSLQEAVDQIQDGMSVMIGGFLGCGNPHHIIDALVAKGVRGLTVISNDAPPTGYGLSRLIDNHQVKRLITTHVGMNPNVAEQVNAGELEVDLTPQGSLAEMIRAGGGGLGAIVTPTGLGTLVEERNPFVHGRITIDGREYLVMKPVRADVALISGHMVDRAGNVWYRGTSRNFSNLMATAADTVICEADHVVELGDIAPENVITQGIFVDYIMDGGAL